MLFTREFIMSPSHSSQNASGSDLFDTRNSTCLKGIAIVMMLYHHCFLATSRYEGQTLSFFLPEHMLNYISSSFKICVCFFAFISAYGICKKMISYSDSDLSIPDQVKQITISRLIKLLGGFIFVFLLVMLFACFYDPERFTQVYGAHRSKALLYFGLDMLGLADMLQTPTYLGTYWYYSLAIALVVMTPFLYLLQKKIGSIGLVFLSLFLTFCIGIQYENLWHYFLCIAVAVTCAIDNTIARLVNTTIAQNPYFNKVLKFLFELALLALLIYFRQGPLKQVLYPIWDAIIPVVFCCFGCEFLFKPVFLNKLLYVLGVYSANIFLLHNYIRKVWFYDYTYSFKYPSLIVLMLLLETFLLSFFIEKLKKLIHLNQFLNRVIVKVENVL